jgi:hypothetical protein
MSENEKKYTNMENGSDKAEQPEGKLESQEKSPEDTVESPQEAIVNIIGEMNSVDQDILTSRRSVTETENKLATLRKDMGAPESTEHSPTTELQNEKIQRLEERRTELKRKKEDWIEQHRRKNLPDGVAFEDEDGGLEAKGGTGEEEEGQRDEKKEKEEKEKNLELRKEWLKKWEKESVKNFEKAMRDNWMTMDAMNLDLSIELMKLRVPGMMEKEAEDYIDGTVDVPSFSTVWVRWEVSSLFDRLLDKPNKISKLEITAEEPQAEVREAA